MKILIYGGKGWIGKQFIDIFDKLNIEYVLGNSRVDEFENTKKEILKINPTHILSTIGRTHGIIGDKKFSTIDYLENEGKLVENIRDNLFAPLSLALICNNLNIHYTYLGTGCIFNYYQFDNTMYNGFTESSLPNFFGSSYSIVKGYTDQFMNILNNCGFQYNNILNLRIRMPINSDNNERNFINKIISYDNICSIANSMSVLPDLIPIAIDLMIKYKTGTINFTNPGTISHNEILQMYKDIVEPNFTWKNFTIEEQNKILLSKRSNNYLSTTLLESLYPSVKNIKDAVRECLHDYKKNKNYLNNFYNIENKIQKNNLLKYNNYLVDIELPEPEPEIKSYCCWLKKDIIQNNNKNLTINNKNLTIDNKNLTIDNNDENINLLVTGGCGFIGSNFINYIYNNYNNINIINIDALYYCANIKNIHTNIINDKKRYVFIKGNLCNKNLLDNILKKYNIRYIIHFAAQSHVQNSFEDSLQYTKDNILGTHTLLEACRKYNKIIRFIHVSTDEVYGESKLNEVNHKTEYSTLYPTNPYAGTKAGAELIAQTYYHSFKLPIIITRGNNVYGPNQYPEKLIPKFIKLLKNNKKVTIQGNGNVIRGFLYITDTVKAFEKILCYGKIGEIYNIGCEKDMEYSINDIAKILIKLIKKDDNYEKWIEKIEDRPFNDTRYYISNDKLKALGWKCETKFIDGLNKILAT